MKLKPNYFLIPIFMIIVSLVGNWLTGRGIGWYKTIKLPSWTPPGLVIGTVWTIIFILAAISAIIFWNKTAHDNHFWLVAAIFVLNGILNIFWSYLFFNRHWLGAAAIEAGLLDLTVIVLIVLIWPVSRIASVLLFPYAGWVAFATYLTYIVWSLNK